MKKILSYVVAGFIILSLGTGFAQESKEETTPEKEGIYPCMCPMHKMMMKGMMKREAIATEDGGVVVLMGDKMVKYDKDLNQVKEVPLKIDIEHIRNTMQQQMKDCPYRKKMMESGGMMMHGKKKMHGMHGDCPHRQMTEQEKPAE